MTPDDESRTLRARLDRLLAAADRLDRDRPGGVPRYLGRVYSGGALPTAVPRVYLTRPLALAATESEGSAVTLTPDTTRSVPVLVLGPGVPAAGDDLIARQTQGRWVAGFGGTAQCGTITFTVRGCVDATFPTPTNRLLPGATVTVYDGNNNTFPVLGTGTTNGSGVYVQPIYAAKTYYREVSHVGFTTSTGTTAAACSGASNTNVGLTLAATAGYCCNTACPAPFPSTLYLTDELFGTIPLTCTAPDIWIGCALATGVPNAYDASCTTLATRDVPVRFQFSGNTLRVSIPICIAGGLSYARTGTCPTITGTTSSQLFTAVSFACDPLAATWQGGFDPFTSNAGSGLCLIYSACSGGPNAARVWDWTLSP